MMKLSNIINAAPYEEETSRHFSFDLKIVENHDEGDTSFRVEAIEVDTGGHVVLYESSKSKSKVKLDSWFTNPVLVGFASYWALNAIDAYQKNKRYTTTIFAKSVQEKTLYKKIVTDLMQTGHYKMIKDKYADGGWMWQLQMKGT